MFLKFLLKLLAFRFGVILQAEIKGQYQSVLRIKAGINSCGNHGTADEEPGSYQQDQRNAKLRAHQQPAQTKKTRAASASISGFIFQSQHQISFVSWQLRS